MLSVKVKDLPVRYNGKRYEKGETFNVEPEHFMPSTMTMVGEVADDQSDHLSDVGDAVVLDKEQLEHMSINGLKEYAKYFNIDLGRTSTSGGMIDKIVRAQEGE